MANVNGVTMDADTSSVQIPPSVVGGDTIIIYTVTPSIIFVGSTSILVPSRGAHSFASFIGTYPFGMPPSGIPLVL